MVEFPGGAYVQIANHGWRYGLAGDDLKPARRGFVAVRHALPVPELYVASDVLGALSPFNVMAGVVNVVASVGLGGGEGESSSAIRSLSRRCSPLDVPDGLRFHVWCDKERMPEGQALLTPDVLALIGEVSTVNNDLTDNVFAEPLGRFATIEEDVEPLHLLVSDYPTWLD